MTKRQESCRLLGFSENNNNKFPFYFYLTGNAPIVHNFRINQQIINFAQFCLLRVGNFKLTRNIPVG